MMLYYPQMKLTRKNWIRYGSLTVALMIVALSLVLWALLRAPGQLEAGVSQPRITPTPEPTPTPATAELRVTPPPTPFLVQVVRNYPPEALDLVADGKVLYTAENAEAAQTALDRYLAENASQGLQPNERLIKAGFDQKLTLEEPSGKGELLTVDEAVNTLKADDTLLPIVRTVVRCVIERGPLETEVRENAALPRGSRIYRNVGVCPYILSYYETVYRGQAAFSEVKTNEFAVGPGNMDRIVENGSMAVGEASAKAGAPIVKLEGFSPIWPVDGTVSGSFGLTDEGTMRYGVEITAESFARIMAPEEGVVVYCAKRGDMGLVIDILHDETGALSRIIGCDRALVELYQRVKRSEQVGVMPEPIGSRLVSIRYELLVNGVPVNPEKYLPKK